MANEIRIKTSIEVINDNSVTDEITTAGDYTHKALDAHVGKRRWGGSYDIAAGYSSQDVCSWNNVVVDVTSVDDLANGDPFVGNPAQDLGTIPATADGFGHN